MKRTRRAKQASFFLFVLMGASAAHADSVTPAATPNNPWAQLPEAYRRDLVRPLNNLRFIPWVNAAYTKWYEKWFFEGGKPKPGVAPKEELFHAYYFNNVLTRNVRNSLILVYAKLKKEGLWNIVKTVKWAGTEVAMLFEATMSQKALRAHLKKREYGDWWLASKGHPWGVRSRFRGAQLHFRGGAFVNVHIDLNNPGDPPSGEVTGALGELVGAIRHLDDDLRNRKSTHTNNAVRAALKKQGIVVPEI